MQRLTAAEATAALRHLGFQLQPATLWKWKQRRHLTPGRGYDPAEIADYLHTRARRELENTSAPMVS